MTSSSNLFSLSDEETNDDHDDISEDNGIHISDIAEEGTDEEDGIGLSDLETDSHKSTDGSDDGSDLADFIDDNDAERENDDDDVWYS